MMWRAIRGNARFKNDGMAESVFIFVAIVARLKLKFFVSQEANFAHSAWPSM